MSVENNDSNSKSSSQSYQREDGECTNQRDEQEDQEQRTGLATEQGRFFSTREPNPLMNVKFTEIKFQKVRSGKRSYEAMIQGKVNFRFVSEYNIDKALEVNDAEVEASIMEQFRKAGEEAISALFRLDNVQSKHVVRSREHFPAAHSKSLSPSPPSPPSSIPGS